MEWHKPPFKLKEIKIEVTHDCNLQCVHCSSLAKNNSGRSLDWSSCKRIIEDAFKMGVKEIAFSGGEPLLWNHLKTAVKQASQFGMTTLLYTTGNASNAEEIMGYLHATGLSRAIFSLFGADAEQHEEVTSCKGNYERTLAVASHCVALGLTTEFHFVPMAHNYGALQTIAERARHLGIKRVSVLRLVPQGRGAKGKDGQLNNRQNLELRGIISDLREKGHQIRLGSPYNIFMLREMPQCCSGIDRLTVGPDLKIFPCDAFKQIPPEAIGVGSEFSDLKSNTLAECWEKSPFLGAVRKYLTTDFALDCQNCSRLNDCLSGCMAQKFYVFGKLEKCPDPMCLMQHGRQ